LIIKDSGGRLISSASLRAVAYRVIGPEERTSLTFTPDPSGGLLSSEKLAAGQWALEIDLQAEGHAYTSSKRFFVR
jgi:nitrogen fixation protein FixH